MTLYTIESLQSLTRKELQALAKSLGFKANTSNQIIIQTILDQQITLTIDDVTETTAAPIVEIKESSNLFSIGTKVEVKVGDVDEWILATIIKVNKKSYRVTESISGNEITLSFTAVRAMSEAFEPVIAASIVKSSRKSSVANTARQSIVSARKLSLRKSISEAETAVQQTLESYSQPTTQWAVSMESCIEEMVASKANFRKKSKGSDDANKPLFTAIAQLPIESKKRKSQVQ